MLGPTPALHDFLKRLANLANVDVTIISGRSRDDIQVWLGAYPFCLIAEHGASRRQPGSQVWEQLDCTVNYAWKEDLLNILRRLIKTFALVEYQCK
jgi:trehalose-6-phosphatase